MKTKLLAMLVLGMILTGISSSTKAQKFEIGISGGAGIPMGDFGGATKLTYDMVNDKVTELETKASTGFGFSVSGKYFMTDKMAIGLNFAYMGFEGKDVDFNSVNPFPFFVIPPATGSFSVIPITASFDYYFMDEGFKPFAGIETGYIMTTAKYNFLSDSYNKTIGSFCVAPVVGAAYGINENLDIFLKAKYLFSSGKNEFDSNSSEFNVGFSSANYLGINLGATFSF